MESHRHNVVLIGFMGTGKSTVGKFLAKQLNWSFTDTDAMIEQKEQMTIAEMFEARGEAYFRSLETKTIEELLAEEHQVLATGGGAVLAEKNRSCMLKNGFVVAFIASPEAIIRRVSSDQSRPLLQGNLDERVHSLLEQRKQAYDFAHMTIDTSELSPERIARIIMKRLKAIQLKAMP
ncbi:shikimate kinase [Paenibacillus eucommiae]|uniref:Shikimate kinase n=1 Tax=Paenibacillus eucommiae TaxID=1355755 RepID=A0ABS4J9H8_9BACL|nr:shikimate kinase [Paenibacillus eucommiae]MBP1996501.1 shikimate kinase [Paenibacillus eucommiae]